jgi:hypothetical protein
MRCVGAVTIGLTLSACVSGSDRPGIRVSDDFTYYEPFDNSRDWGSRYLVGPPAPLANRQILDYSISRGGQRPVPSLPTKILNELP